MKQQFFVVFILLFFISSFLIGNPAIQFFVRYYPQSTQLNTDKFHQKIKHPQHVLSHIQKGLHIRPGGVEGLFATYQGQLALSNFDGFIQFIRGQREPDFLILVTPAIVPVMMLSNIVHHWVPESRQPNVLYRVTRKQDASTQIYYWETKEESIPKNFRIPLNTIVIFAKPKNVVIPEGITLTTDHGQWLLPPIYTKKEFDFTARSLELLLIKHFFGGQLRKNNPTNIPTYYSTQLH